MYKSHSINIKKTGVLNKLVADYLEEKESLRKFYSYSPNLTGFKRFLDANPYSHFDRKSLSKRLHEQANEVNNSSKFSLNNITLLGNNNCFTVTTGHQLCLLTGPLYFVYKILSTINLAEELRKEFPAYEFVPVYWMATEDHDFEEINHFHCNNKTLSWKSEQSGAVGEFNTIELKTIVHQVKETFGISKNAGLLMNLFENAYLRNSNLALATRFLVNELFGEFGLVTIDGNDREFKAQFRNEFKEDIFNEQSYKTVNTAITELAAQGYKSQVNPRPINCFYLEKGRRTRIEKSGKDFLLVDTKQEISASELKNIIENFPEKISPNVVLRPLFQQKILPNLAYVGGPGELAYWLEFKQMFEAYKVPFPILVPRKFITVVEKAVRIKMEKLDFSSEDLFTEEQDLIQRLQEKTQKIFEVENELEIIETLFAGLKNRTNKIDQSLNKKVDADHQKTKNQLDSISKKANKALRKQLDVELQQIKTLKEKLFPKAIPQERYENFSSFYLKDGKGFIAQLKSEIEALKLEMLVLQEE